MPVAAFPGRHGWGYDGVYISAAHDALRRPARPAAARRRRARARASRCCSTSSTTTSAPPACRRSRRSARTSPIALRDAVGPGDQLRRRRLRRRARVGAPERRAVDPRLPCRRPAPRRDPRDRRRQPRAPGRRGRAPRARREPRAFVIAESGLNDPKVMRASSAAAGAATRAVGRRLPPRAARAADRRPRGLLRRVRRRSPRWRRRSTARTSTTAPTRRSAAAASAPRPTTCRPSAFVVFSSNHDQVGNRALGDRLPVEVRPLAAFVHAAGTVHADALPGRGARRARAVPVLLRPHRRGHRRRDARGPPARVRRLRRVRRRARCPTRRTRRPSSAPSSRATGEPEGLRDLYAALLRVRARAAAGRRRRRSTSTSTPAGCASRRGPYDAARQLLPRDRARPARAARPSRAAPRTTPRSSRASWSCRRCRGRCCRVTRDLAGTAVPAGRRPGTGAGPTSRCSPRTPSASSCACSTTTTTRRGSSCTERTAFNWHGYLPGVGPGPALRLPRPRPLRPARRAPLQPGQAADRPVREVDRGQGPLEPRQRAPVRPDPAPATTPTSSATTRTPRSRSPSASSSTRASTGRTTGRRTRRCTRW